MVALAKHCEKANSAHENLRFGDCVETDDDDENKERKDDDDVVVDDDDDNDDNDNDDDDDDGDDDDDSVINELLAARGPVISSSIGTPGVLSARTVLARSRSSRVVELPPATMLSAMSSSTSYSSSSSSSELPAFAPKCDSNRKYRWKAQLPASAQVGVIIKASSPGRPSVLGLTTTPLTFSE